MNYASKYGNFCLSIRTGGVIGSGNTAVLRLRICDYPPKKSLLFVSHSSYFCIVVCCGILAPEQPIVSVARQKITG
jgi:hypothetical protein